jgi:hypothetical protein
VFEFIGTVYRAIKSYYNPLAGSHILKDFPPRGHVEIERNEPIRIRLIDKWIIEIKPLTVDQVLRIGHMQYGVRAYVQKLDSIEDNVRFIQKAKIKSDFYNLVIQMIYDFSKKYYHGWWRRLTYKKLLFLKLREDVQFGLSIFDKVLNFNSSIESFFFESSFDDGRKVQLPPRNSWLAVGCEYDNGRGNGRSYLQTEILRIYASVMNDYENNQIQNILAKAEKNGSS